MISIPTPIKYDKAIHFQERITKPLDLKNDLLFIRSVLEDLQKDNAEVYLVSYGGKVAICRKDLKPAVSHHTEHHNYFALKNQSGSIIKNGMNMRRPESIISVLKGMFRRNPAKLSLLARNHDMSVAERCKLFNYTLMKQNTPF